MYRNMLQYVQSNFKDIFYLEIIGYIGLSSGPLS